VNDLRAALLRSFRWRSDPLAWPEERSFYADYTYWWRDPEILRALGPALAALFPDRSATVVMGTESRGSLIGPLVATHLGAGFAEVRKGAMRGSDDDQWLTRLTPPDYNDRHLELAVRRGLIQPADRVLFVDDWAARGAQAAACKQLAEDAGATWVGSAVIVDALENATDRRTLNMRALVHVRDLEKVR
jgi:adenine phosphoribosyltransferase